MLKTFLGIMTCMFISSTAFGSVDASLSFSTDNGKSWDTDFPLVKKAQEILVKVSWSVEENRDIKSNVLISTLYCRERDFASANRGKQYWLPNNKPAWFQRLKKYYCGAKNPRPFIYRLNLGARKADTMGKNNKWDKAKRKFLDAPQAACAAFPAGTYRFYVRLNYRLKGSNELVDKIKEFDISIEGDTKSSASPEDLKKK